MLTIYLTSVVRLQMLQSASSYRRHPGSVEKINLNISIRYTDISSDARDVKVVDKKWAILNYANMMIVDNNNKILICLFKLMQSIMTKRFFFSFRRTVYQKSNCAFFCNLWLLSLELLSSLPQHALLDFLSLSALIVFGSMASIFAAQNIINSNIIQIG